ncbi:AAA family ATPase [Candidatus Falkowbacteria bacterium RIFOXYB2_FULL_34_18]|uniref:Replication-associated recombination protein A n=1 Tax=Candidatus Falkowbacteria bacterium RIFOXYD2_FULL_34_120 TaxID=1798007 RepID=A0A1F5TPA4_9BACT|nr:MAG: AAA family ATPase [Candidatus Falkowbacteria bacterium RIFOXYC12_FULL_34_55]OGF28745.1 MAG: AAA family ATPase [Candidatus Falkowbacteria bacterium RIFOXYB2_FULL_34_18]OGF38110.1 MAG: AAA family ATPase [Candidatus Falkowbacteria bacterium RIFOXYC2_FULL_34_220]OGF38364.1 MAG: AAA family ATPase [Candidatus Falkowbacteria bacterium RIFOXYD12_FULL_34_57]OGF40351.1 MAG: AAA family ATPase [Candidatus Falkowbacteria bacterium RIFOXYD2_FULL_34_120]
MINANLPLASRIRPKKIDDFYGQEEIIGKGKLLRNAIQVDKLPSMIFWGPPGSGKTTLASIIAEQTKSQFEEISAVSSGLKDLRDIILKAKENIKINKKTILFIDEIHRWNKKQQDGLLPYVERGIVTLIGATTENPSFEVRSALLSRCRVFVLKCLSKDSIIKIINRALLDKENGLGNLNLKISQETISVLAQMSNGDARSALSALEYASEVNTDINTELIKEAFQKSHLMYDKNGDEHYNIISALHKSMRGSDPSAALYWLARMLEGGEEPLYIARRLVRFASEDIGLANSRALEQAVAAHQACHFLGMPECNVILAQAVVYMAKCKKSNELYAAYNKIKVDIEKYGNLPVPMHIRNAPTNLMRDLGYGGGYKYSPDYGYTEKQDYLPEELKNRKYLK